MQNLANPLIQLQINFHQSSLQRIKSKVKGCSYISYVRAGNDYFVKTVVNKNPQLFPLEGEPQDVTAKSYQDLLENIQNFYYAEN